MAAGVGVQVHLLSRVCLNGARLNVHSSPYSGRAQMTTEPSTFIARRGVRIGHLLASGNSRTRLRLGK